MNKLKNILTACAIAVAGSVGAAGPAELLAHADDMTWLLPGVPYPTENAPTPERVELGKKLFFDPRLSADNSVSCATCHNPVLGWADGRATAKSIQGKDLQRASPTIVNAAFNSIQMWDGRKKSLEDQAMGPMESMVEMAMNLNRLFAWLKSDADYAAAFAAAYPGEAIDDKTVSKAIASFERTVISNNSPFDRWLRGDANAMSASQIRGFRLFTDENKVNCAVCHQAPNFTDNGFHNLGLPSYGAPEPDVGRYAIKPIAVLKGAFKTPTLREVARTAPYFHDGSAKSLMEVVEHYNKGGVVRKDISPEMRELGLSQQEMQDIVAFMQALTSPQINLALPELPY